MAAAAADTQLHALNHTVQQQARVLNAQLSQVFKGNSSSSSSTPGAPLDLADVSIDATASELRKLTSCNTQLAKALAGAPDQITPSQAAPTEEAEELRAACSQRHHLLQELLQSLDDSVLGLRSQLDACHKLLCVPPCKEDPEAILRYAHTLRHGFAPLGSAPGLLQVPPAPQLPFMLHSTLRVYNMDLAAQQHQQQAAQQLPKPPGVQLLPDLQKQQQQQQPALPGAPTAAAATAAQQHPAEAAPVPAPAPVVQPIIDFRLNTDMDEDLDLGETASEEESDDDEEEDTSVTDD